MHMKLSTRHYLYSLTFNRIRLATTWTTGTSNRTQDGMYIPYLDYDFAELNGIRHELQHLQDIFNLGNFYILQSSEKRYHAICLTKLKAKEFIELLECSSCDSAFKRVPRYRSIRNWVLRCYSKDAKQHPELIETLLHKTAKQESSAHCRMLKLLHQSKGISIQNPDYLKKIALVTYKTAERKKQDG